MALHRSARLLALVVVAVAISGCAGAGGGNTALPALSNQSGTRATTDLIGGGGNFYAKTVGTVLSTVTDGTVTGTVVTKKGAAVAGVTVTASGGAGSTVTASNGSFRLSLPAGTYTLSLSGSHATATATVSAGTTTSVGTITY